MSNKTIKITIKKNNANSHNPLHKDVKESTQEEKEAVFSGYTDLNRLSKGLMEEDSTGESVVALYVKEIQRLSKHLHRIKQEIKTHESHLNTLKAKQAQNEPNADKVLRVVSAINQASKGKYPETTKHK